MCVERVKEALEVPIEKWTGRVREVRLGGNSRKEVVVGGATARPFLHFEGTIASRLIHLQPGQLITQVRDCYHNCPAICQY